MAVERCLLCDTVNVSEVAIKIFVSADLKEREKMN